MTVNLGLRRIASLTAFLVATGIASASQAGIIPWAYDAVFGPVRYPAYGYGYSPYAVSYSRPVYYRSGPRYAPVSYGYSSGCSPCSTSYYAPVTYAAPSYGCGPVVAAPSCGPCGGTSYASTGGCLSGCAATPSTTSDPAAKPATNGKSAWNSTKKPGEVTKEPAPTPRTFQESDRGGASPAGATSTDGFGTEIRQRNKQAVGQTLLNDVDVNRPVSNEEEPTISKPKKTPAKTPDLDDNFPAQPEANPAKPNEKKFEEPIENKVPDPTDSNTETTIRKTRPMLNLDAKIVWQSELPRSRVPFHAKLAKASVTRRVPSLNSDWTPVVAKPTGTQLVRK